jgi:hypothetical protein
MPTCRSAVALRTAFLASLVAAVSCVACDDGAVPAPALVAAAPKGSPLGELTPPRSTSAWKGVVETRLAAGSYTYHAVRDRSGLRWIATTGAGVDVGRPVTVQSWGTRKDFYSRRLDRSFAELEFGRVDAVQPSAGGGMN